MTRSPALLVLATLGFAACSSSTAGPVNLTPQNVPNGGACIVDADCAKSTEGTVGCGIDAKICQLGVPGAVGSTPCLGTKGAAGTSAADSPFDRSSMEARGFLCDRADGLFCDSTTRACASLRAVGAACKNDNQCVVTAHCNSDVMRTCEAGSPADAGP